MRVVAEIRQMSLDDKRSSWKWTSIIPNVIIEEKLDPCAQLNLKNVGGREILI